MLHVARRSLCPLLESNSLLSNDPRRCPSFRVAVPIEVEVTELEVGNQDAIVQTSASDAGAESQYDDGAGNVFRSPHGRFSDACRVCIIEYLARVPQRCSKEGRGVKADPLGVDVCRSVGHSIEHHTGKCDTNRFFGRLIRFLLVLRANVLNHRRDFTRDILRHTAVWSGNTQTVGQQLARTHVNRGTLDIGAANVDSDRSLPHMASIATDLSGQCDRVSWAKTVPDARDVDLGAAAPNDEIRDAEASVPAVGLEQDSIEGESVSRTIKLAVVPGDGIGREVTAEANRVLDAVLAGSDVTLERTEFHLGADRYLETGETFPEADQQAIAAHDAILFGAVGGVPGDPRLRDANIERGLLLKLRFDFDHYANVRPCKLYPGVRSTLANPGDVDFVVVREGTEGPYAGNGGRLRAGTPHEVATEVSVNTAYGIERVVRYAFALAAKRERKKLTWVHKTNVLVHSGATWQRIVQAISAEYPEVSVDYLHVDAATIFMVQDPSRFDVIVTDNLFGDILTDLAGAIGGGIGLAASGSVNPEGTFPSMFEPVHGSAPDIAGQQIADPTAAILSAAIMLDHLDLTDEAARIRAAVEQDLATRGDQRRSTSAIADAIMNNL